MVDQIIGSEELFGRVNITRGLKEKKEPKAPYLRDGICIFPRKEFESLKKSIMESYHLREEDGLDFLLSQLHKVGLDFKQGVRESAEIILQDENGEEEKKLINLDPDHFGEELTVEIEPEPPELPSFLPDVDKKT